MRFRTILILVAVLVVLGGVYLIVSSVNQPETEDTTQPTVYLWNIDMGDIEHIEVQLPHEGLSQAFVKLAEGDWRFDDESQSAIDPERWGAGITLLLSGPGADRVISENTSQAQLAEYGLTGPSMVITLNLADESTMIIELGDPTFDGSAYYVKAPNTDAVATVYSGWYDVIKSLVTDPPYVAAED